MRYSVDFKYTQILALHFAKYVLINIWLSGVNKEMVAWTFIRYKKSRTHIYTPSLFKQIYYNLGFVFYKRGKMNTVQIGRN